MNRRKFFKSGSLAALGTAVLSPAQLFSNHTPILDFKGRRAKNIIFLVSDGMSTGTLNMANLYKVRQTGTSSHWLRLYDENRVTRALMDTASANSIVTDSSAGSSSWGGGVRVNNGALNVGPKGEKYLPILQKFKKAGKKVGCVTTVPITHATPAGFCVNSDSRNSQGEIASQYLELGFDVMMGGGSKYFDAAQRKDKTDLLAAFREKGYHVVQSRSEMRNAPKQKQILGVFSDDALPYSLDQQQDADLNNRIPTLAEMTRKAIDQMKDAKNGFVMQVEAGKVDWGAHANDIGAVLFDQLAFDEAVGAAIEFAETDKNTLVIITTDHGNANPGIIYGKSANNNFDSIAKYRKTNEWILNNLHADTSVSAARELVEYHNGFAMTEEEAKTILGYYTGLAKIEDGLYNYRKLPFKAFADIQKQHNNVGWISMDHSADYVELAMFGPGSELLKPFVKNTDLHYLMLQAAEVENKF